MSGSSRILNRVLLAVLGIAWLAAGSLVLLWHLQPEPVIAALAPLAAPAAQLDWPIVAAIAGAALILIAAIHTATRGRGRSDDALVAGSITVDKHAVRDVFRAELGEHPDLLDLDVQPWRVRGREAWQVTLRVRRGARLDELADRAAAAADGTRARLGAAAPILIHLSGGLRSAVAHARRAE